MNLASFSYYYDNVFDSTETKVVSAGDSFTFSESGYITTITVLVAESGFSYQITGNGTSTATIKFNTVGSGSFIANVNYDTSAPSTYTLTLNDNYQGGASTPTVYEAGTTITLPNRTRTGYSFIGWYNSAEGGSKIGDAGDSYTVNATAILYAHWESAQGTMQIVYIIDGVSKSIDEVSVSEGSSYTVSYSGKKFLSLEYATGGTGWEYSISGATITFDTVNSSSKLSVYARFRSFNEYTITYNKGDYGTGSDYTATKTEDTAITLRGSTYTRDGYTQDGWSINSDGSTKDYNLSASYTANAAIALYPHWKQNTYTVRYYKGSWGTGTNTTDTKYGGVDLTLKGAIFTSTREGYVQAGWTKSNSTSATKLYDLEGTYSDNKTITLYPFWVKYYTVTYNHGSSASGTQRTATKYDGIALTLLGSIFTRTAHSQNGWTTTDLGTKEYDLEGSFTIDADTTLYPSWTKTECIVLFDSCGGSAVTSFKTISVGSAYGTLPTTSRDGYSFNGWYTAQSGGTKIEENDIVTSAETQILYAQWTATITNKTLTFNPNGGTVSESSRQVLPGNAIGTLPTATRQGHTQNGWIDAPSGTTVITSSTVMPDNDMTIYARWVPNPLTITFNANGGTPSETSRTVNYGQQIGRLPTARLSQNKLIGWFTESSGGTEITNAYVPTSSITVYAHWEEAETVDWWNFAID